MAPVRFPSTLSSGNYPLTQVSLSWNACFALPQHRSEGLAPNSSNIFYFSDLGVNPSMSKMFQNSIYDYIPASQDEPDPTYDNGDAASSPRVRRCSPKVILANALFALIAILFLSFAVYQMHHRSSSSLLSPDSFFPPCKSSDIVHFEKHVDERISSKRTDEIRRRRRQRLHAIR